MAVLSEEFQITAPAPGAVRGVSAQITGPPGLATYYYWWTANYPIGLTVISAPLLMRGAPNPLTPTNFVTITGQPALGATSYDLLRTNSPQLPSTVQNNIAVTGGLPSPTFQDVGDPLSPYDIIGLAAGAPVSEFITLNNRDFATPTLIIAPWGLAVPGVTLTAGALTFPDGSKQTTAGQTPLSVPIWRAYSVTLVPPNWKVTGPDGTVTLVPTAAALTQNIPVGVLPPNSYLTFARTVLTAGPVGGTPTAASVAGVIRTPGDSVVVPVGINLKLTNIDNVNNFGDTLPSNTVSPGNSIINTQQTLGVLIQTTGGNISALLPPCSFVIYLLWSVTN